MRRSVCVVAVFAALLSVLGCGDEERPRLTALFMKDTGWLEEDIRALTKEFQKDVKSVDVLPFFVAPESQHTAIISPAATRAQAYDVMMVEGVWMSEFAEGEFIADLTDRMRGVSVSTGGPGIMPFAAEWFRLKGKWYAMPWMVDCLCLFYNKKMLAAAGIESPPATWDDLAAQSKRLKEKGVVPFPIAAHWAHQDSLICDFGCVLLAKGGSFMNAKREPAFADQPGVESLAFMRRLLDDGLANPMCVNSNSKDAAHLLSEGQAAFCLNWVETFSVANDRAKSRAAGEIGVTLAPGSGGPGGEKGVRSASIARAFGLAVNADSALPEIAWRYINFLANPENQVRYCKSALPVERSLYEKPDAFGARAEMIRVAKEQFAYVHTRPRLYYYSKFSLALQAAVRGVLREKEKLVTEKGQGLSPVFQTALAGAADRAKEAARERPLSR